MHAMIYMQEPFESKSWQGKKIQILQTSSGHLKHLPTSPYPRNLFLSLPWGKNLSVSNCACNIYLWSYTDIKQERYKHCLFMFYTTPI